MSAAVEPRGRLSDGCCRRRLTPAAVLFLCRVLVLFWVNEAEPAKGDLPAHCLVRHVLGEWEIQEGLWLPCQEEGNLTTDAARLHDPYCGYGIPDRVDAHGPMTPPNVSASFHALRTSRFTLFPDFRIEFEDGSSGLWTLVYDEGLHFEVSTPQNRRFFAFFKYQLAPDGQNRAWSYCHTTLVGWWERPAAPNLSLQDVEKAPPVYDIPEPIAPETAADALLKSVKRGCWWGRKVGEDLSVPTNEVPKERRTPLEVPLWPTSRPPDVRTVAAVVRKNLAADAPWEPLDEEYVEIRGRKLRTMEEVWAHAGHQPLLISRQNIESTHLTLSVRPPLHLLAGIKPFGSPAGSDPPWRTVRDFDWANEDHVALRIGRRQSVIPDAPNQGGCGSCYAIATGTVLTSRLWIRYAANDDVFGKVNVSAFQGTSCNVYNQGCGGGYVFLALKFGQEHGFRTEDCVSEYHAMADKHKGSLSPNLQTCFDLGGQLGTSAFGCQAPPARASLPDSCNLSVKVTSWHYVGGVYGGCSEDDMLRTLWEHGPMAASIEPTIAFTVYKKGVFRAAYNSLVEQGDNWVWEKVDHAVVISGWGWAKHGDSWLPYWKVRNSWGTKWGEGGYARVLRGVNEMAIERVAVVGEVSLFRGGEHIPPLLARSLDSQGSSNASKDSERGETLVESVSPVFRGSASGSESGNPRDAATNESAHTSESADADAESSSGSDDDEDGDMEKGDVESTTKQTTLFRPIQRHGEVLEEKRTGE
ncbi:cathepsin CPC2 [Toxoplasma gondii p89]|uniref:Dipeptidyl peptidase 1 n=2 Tax=Toxoplasma gondii TaxID=5811 RepID=A0A3R8AG72_TOXGO|nr:cathepsin CPC2 [Toxoplasma gondii p89]RQX66829.1 cathepsin CPC2 [Toxoplasma gondii CAST]